jgi:hypothetical protein
VGIQRFSKRGRDVYRKVRRANLHIRKYRMKGQAAQQFLSTVYKKIWKDAR